MSIRRAPSNTAILPLGPPTNLWATISFASRPSTPIRGSTLASVASKAGGVLQHVLQQAFSKSSLQVPRSLVDIMRIHASFKSRHSDAALGVYSFRSKRPILMKQLISNVLSVWGGCGGAYSQDLERSGTVQGKVQLQDTLIILVSNLLYHSGITLHPKRASYCKSPPLVKKSFTPSLARAMRDKAMT